MQNYLLYNDDEEINLTDMFKYLWKNIKSIVLVTIACAIIGAVFGYYKSGSAAGHFADTLVYARPMVVGNTYKDVSSDIIEIIKHEINVDDVSAELVEKTTVIKMTAKAETEETAETSIEQAIVELQDITESTDFIIDIPGDIHTYSVDKVNVKTILKWVLIFALIGALIMCAIYGCIFIFCNKLSTPEQIREKLKLSTLGILDGSKESKVEFSKAAVLAMRDGKKLLLAEPDIDAAKITEISDSLVSELEKSGCEVAYASEHIDREIQARDSDAAVIVVREGQTGTNAARETVVQLVTAGCKVIGAVLIKG